MKTDYEVDLEDYSSVAKLAIALISTTPNQKIDHKLRIQKLAFLADKMIHDSDLDDDLDFVPLHMGTYSENLESSIHKLADEGIITIGDEKSLKSELTEKGKQISRKIEEELPELYATSALINDSTKDLSSNEITALVYELYPSGTENSLIKNKLPKTDKFDSFRLDVSNMEPGEVKTIKTRLGHELEVRLDTDGKTITIGRE